MFLGVAAVLVSVWGGGGEPTGFVDQEKVDELSEAVAAMEPQPCEAIDPHQVEALLGARAEPVGPTDLLTYRSCTWTEGAATLQVRFSVPSSIADSFFGRPDGVALAVGPSIQAVALGDTLFLEEERGRAVVARSGEEVVFVELSNRVGGVDDATFHRLASSIVMEVLT